MRADRILRPLHSPRIVEPLRLFAHWSSATIVGGFGALAVAGAAYSIAAKIGAGAERPLMMLLPVLIVAGAGLLGGAALGLAQWTELERHVSPRARTAWMSVTMGAVGLALLFGFRIVDQLGGSIQAFVADSPALLLGIATIGGVLAGAVIGIAQSLVLRERFRGAGSWIAFSAIAGAVAFAFACTTASSIPAEAPAAVRAVLWAITVLAACSLGGAIEGASFAVLARRQHVQAR